MRTNQPSILRGVVAGVAAGITATLIMDQFQKLTTAEQKAIKQRSKLAQGESPCQIAHEQVQKEQKAADHDDSTEIVAPKIADATAQPRTNEEQKNASR